MNGTQLLIQAIGFLGTVVVVETYLWHQCKSRRIVKKPKKKSTKRKELSTWLSRSS